jgi:glycosyltransferase involved in cell wall biosynthesis
MSGTMTVMAADGAATRKLRVLTLINTVSKIGGAERLAADLLFRLDPTRFERIVCTTRRPPGDTFDDELRAAGVRVIPLDRRTRADLGAWAPLLALLRGEPVDVLHAHKHGANVWGAVLGRLMRVPVVIAHEHAWSWEGQRFRRVLDRELVARGADVVLAVSRNARRRMIEEEGLDPRVVRLLPNGIAALAAPSGRNVRGELGIEPDAPVIGTVSVLRAEKALEVLIGAAARLAPRFPALRVVIAGRGEEEPRLRALVSELGLEQTVLLVGPRNDVPELLAALDVAVCCSDFEGSPLSVMEYMAAGLPVAATRVGGVPELIEHGVHGLLVDPRNVDLLADAIEQLLRDAGLRKQMGGSGRERQKREFDIDATVRRVEALYEELYDASRRRRNGRRATA